MAQNSKNRRLYVLLIILIILIAGMFILLTSVRTQTGGGGIPREPAADTAEPVLNFNASDPNLVLVNKDNPVEEDYVPEDLVYIDETMRVSDRAAQYQRMQPEAAAAFEALVTGAAEQGLTIKMTTAYRPYSYQADLYYYYLEVKGKEWTEEYSAPPGASEHQTGLATDVSCPAVKYQLEESFGETEEGIWLENHAHEYGYILRYQKGKEGITGYSYEPWHIRYVGIQAARLITEKDITLEEFLRDI